MHSILVIGAGLSGCVAARLLAESGLKVDVIDKRNHIAGNCYDYYEDGILVHKYGPHLFHTNNKNVFDFLSKYTEWIKYEHKVKALYDNKYLTLPVNQETKQIVGENNILDIFFRPYTRKMWGMELEEINPNIINRVPIRDDLNDKYFPNDIYQYMPLKGYTEMCRNILDHKNISVSLNCNYDKSNKDKYNHIFSCIPIDVFYDNKFGELPYRSIKFHTLKEIGTKSEHVTVNYTDDGPFTRWTEWKNLPYGKNNIDNTIITYEEPCDYKENNMERYYPINDLKGNNKNLYNKYKELSTKDKNVTHLGRLGLYAYLDMHQAVNSTMIKVKKYINEI